MPTVRNHTVLNNRIATGEQKNSRETIKQVFWQTSINEQRPKLKIWINDSVIDGLIDTRCGCNNNLTRILEFKLASSGGKYLDFRDWHFISDKTEYKKSNVQGQKDREEN